MTLRIRGLYPDVVVPLAADGRVLERELIMFVQQLSRVGVVVGGVVVNGRLGESEQFDGAQRQRIVERAHAAAPADFSVLAGVRHEPLPTAIEAVREAAEAGADGAVIYLAEGGDPDEASAYVDAIAAATDLPLVLHLPSTGGPRPADLGRLARHDAVVAVCTSTLDAATHAAQRASVDGLVPCLTATHSSELVDRLADGCDGAILGTSTVGTTLWAALVAACRDGRPPAARELYTGRIAPVLRAIGASEGDEAVDLRPAVKDALVQLGLFSTSVVRGDRQAPDPDAQRLAREGLVTAGLLPA